MKTNTLAETYAEQLDDIGKVLAKAGIITMASIRCHGVRFAVRRRFEKPRKTLRRAKKESAK